MPAGTSCWISMRPSRWGTSAHLSGAVGRRSTLPSRPLRMEMCRGGAEIPPSPPQRQPVPRHAHAPFAPSGLPCPARRADAANSPWRTGPSTEGLENRWAAHVPARHSSALLHHRTSPGLTCRPLFPKQPPPLAPVAAPPSPVPPLARRAPWLTPPPPPPLDLSRIQHGVCIFMDPCGGPDRPLAIPRRPPGSRLDPPVGGPIHAQCY